MKTETKIAEEKLDNLAMHLRMISFFLLVGVLIYLSLSFVGIIK